jgi:hypothetical protein
MHSSFAGKGWRIKLLIQDYYLASASSLSIVLYLQYTAGAVCNLI